MIKLVSAHIEELRGIRRLDVSFQCENMVISGPNGSGKSGVIDAIEFCLTGHIGRLAGPGTKGLSVLEHGPHVDKTRLPNAAFVELNVRIPHLNKTATIRRSVSEPQKPTIEPADPDVVATFAEVGGHPELALSRREILRFILVEPGKRSEEIQSLLRLEDIGRTRAALNACRNRIKGASREAATKRDSCQDALQRHLQVSSLKSKNVIEAVNARRRTLQLKEIEELTPDSRLDEGISTGGTQAPFNRLAALRDINVATHAARELPSRFRAALESIVAQLGEFAQDASLLAALRQRSLVEDGIGLLSGNECPLCDTSWESELALREHLRTKLNKSTEAQARRNALLQNGETLARAAAEFAGLLAPLDAVAESLRASDATRLLKTYGNDLDAIRTASRSIDGLVGLSQRMCSGLFLELDPLAVALQSLHERVVATPDQTALTDAQSYITTAQVRLADYREARRQEERARFAYDHAREAYEAYCEVLESELNTLYAQVESDFSFYYRAINEDDEAAFTAQLTPTEGKLDLKVNFYERGFFPPAAFHSEGHQDGMGVCLYLALMKKLFGDRFTMVLLDDVVMSVDAGHRYQFCKLLKAHFSGTQFVITTHDRVWAEQMKSAGLVTSRRSLAFHGWSVDTGPLVESGQEVWEDIESALSRGKVEVAAAALRHHLEYIARLLADQLGARVPFRADGNYELGDLLPNVLARAKALYGTAADAAQSWGSASRREEASLRKAKLSSSNGALSVEQWAVNKAVHYNAWANFGRSDFIPVVAAFKDLLSCFGCDSCGSWLYITPRSTPDALRCGCGSVNISLKAKGK